MRNFGSHIGRAEVADEVVGPNFTELWISLDPEVQYEETVAKIQSVVDGYPGLYRDLLTYLRERIKEDYMETATPGVKSTRDGWLNRYLQAEAGERNPLRGVAVTRQRDDRYRRSREGRYLRPLARPGCRSAFRGRDLAVTTDFRDVFGEVVMRQLGADEQTARRVFPGYALSTARFPG